MTAARRVLDAAPAWMAPYAQHAGRIDAALGQGASISHALSAESRLRFVPADAQPQDEAYEAFIFRTGTVPTRDNLHDLFNGLAWLRFPEAKRRLNQLQAGEIARAGIGATRGPLRDALTLFDENGAVLDAPPAVWDALAVRDWQRLFVGGRALWREARLLVFGHALLEKLQTPRKNLTAHVLWAPGACRSVAIDDAAIAAALQPGHLAAKPFAPLPVLGVPGWWAPNESPAFYDDVRVFRPSRPAPN